MTHSTEQLNRQMIVAVEEEMRAVLGVDGAAPDPFFGMLHYHMGWADEKLEPVAGNGGKRIRPLLCLLTCHAAGGQWLQATPAGAAIELLHNFTLIHDDIQDASPTRRGRPTLWRLWGVPQAINSGDALFALSHLAMTRLLQREVPAGVVVHALRRFDEVCLELTQGQYADMDFEERAEVSVAEYVAMITGKTAVLLSLCTELGALLAGRDEETVAHYAAFGRDLGLAFQVRDDILGIWGIESVIGKSAATDIETRKKSLPVLYGLSQSEALSQLYRQQPQPEDFVNQAIRLLDRTDARAYAEERAAAYSESALSHLAAAAPNDDAQPLRRLAGRLLDRQA